MTRQNEAAWWAPGGGHQWTSDGGNRRVHPTFEPVALQLYKHGRYCTVAKLVVAEPLGEIVLAMPYRNRQEVEHVSLPPVALRYANERGARLWVVRLDGRGECYALPLSQATKPGVGWLKPSEAQPEWFVPLTSFSQIAWQDWPYVEEVVRLGEEQAPGVPTPPRQLAMFGAAQP